MLSSHFVFYCKRHLLEDEELNRANISRGFLFPLMALNLHFAFRILLYSSACFFKRHLLEDEELNRANISRGFLFPLMALNLHFTLCQHPLAPLLPHTRGFYTVAAIEVFPFVWPSYTLHVFELCFRIHGKYCLEKLTIDKQRSLFTCSNQLCNKCRGMVEVGEVDV